MPNTKNTIVLEDAIMQKGLPATVGSNVLRGFKAPFDAAVAERLRAAGYALESVPAAAEFGLALSGPTLPPSAAVTAVLEGRAAAALTAQLPAPNAPLFCIRPTYGTVSRYGLIPAVCSMDTVSIVCKELKLGFEILSVIAGHDERDGVSEPETSYQHAPAQGTLKTAALDETNLPLLPVLPAVMAILASAELSGNLSRYDGLRFGYRPPQFSGLDDLYRKTRTGGFGRETKLALVLGTMVLSEGFYEKRYAQAMKIRRLLCEQMAVLLSKYDVLSMVSAEIAPLCGLPGITLPDGTHLVAARKNESSLFAAAEQREQGVRA